MTAAQVLMFGSPSSAALSDCGIYRYRLERRFGSGPRGVCFVMLNPSTANADTDDPTIRRCIGFARRWGFDRLVVVNLYGFRATDPTSLMQAADPVGPENDAHVRRAIEEADLVVAAWGHTEQQKPG